MGADWVRRMSVRLDATAPKPEPVVRRRLRVGAVDDGAERRADHLAARALESIREPAPGVVARMAATDGITTGRIRRSAGSSRTVDGIGAAGGELDAETSSRIRRSMGGGRALEPSLRSTMEGAFAADLSGVRVHVDASSARIARSMNADAFTLGRDVYFAGGAYSPGTSQGLQTVAHELAHVVDGGSSTVTRQMVHRRLAYKVADLDRRAPKRSMLQKMSIKKDPVAPLRKVMTGY